MGVPEVEFISNNSMKFYGFNLSKIHLTGVPQDDGECNFDINYEETYKLDNDSNFVKVIPYKVKLYFRPCGNG